MRRPRLLLTAGAAACKPGAAPRSGRLSQPPRGRGCPQPQGGSPRPVAGSGADRAPRPRADARTEGWGRPVHLESCGARAAGPKTRLPLPSVCLSVLRGHLAHQPFLHEDAVVREAGGTGPVRKQHCSGSQHRPAAGQPRADPRPRPPGRAAGSGLRAFRSSHAEGCPHATRITRFKCTIWGFTIFIPIRLRMLGHPQNTPVPLAAPRKVRVPSAPSTSHSASVSGARAPAAPATPPGKVQGPATSKGLPPRATPGAVLPAALVGTAGRGGL